MYKFTTYILTLLLATGFSLVSAQDSTKKWSLQDCIDYAYEHNLQLQRNRNNIIISENNLQQSKNDRLPSLSGSTSWSNSYGRSIDYTTNGYTNQNSSNVNYGIGTSVNLFSGFRKKYQIEKGEIDLQTQLLDIETAKENLALNITSMYLNILYANEQLQIAKENLTTRIDQQKRIQQLVDAGKMPKGDLLEQQSQVAKVESNIVEAENRLSLAYLDLYQALDISAEQSFLVEAPNIKAIQEADGRLLNYANLYETIIAERPSMKALDYRLKSAEKDIDIAKAGYYPNLGLNANIGSGYSNLRYNYKKDANNPSQLVENGKMSFLDQYELNLSKSWSLSLSIPIFNKFQTRTAVKNAKLQLQDVQIQKQVERNKLYKELQQAYTNALAAVKKYDAQSKTVKALKETFRYAEEKYQLGKLSNFDYNESLNNLTVARSNMLQAKYEYIFRTKILEFYSGLPLQF